MFLRHQKAESAGVNHARIRTGFVFHPRPRERREGWQSHGRFTSRCSLLFKRMHKGVCLMIYYLMPLWKSKWILESAQLLNPDQEECDLWKWHQEPCVSHCVSSQACVKQHVGLIKHIEVMYSAIHTYLFIYFLCSGFIKCHSHNCNLPVWLCYLTRMNHIHISVHRVCMSWLAALMVLLMRMQNRSNILWWQIWCHIWYSWQLD